VANPGAHVVLWRDGKVINLGGLGGVSGNSSAINDLGEVTGLSDLAGDQTSHAFLWKNGVMRDLGTLPGDYSSSGSSINNLSQIVGQSCDINPNCRGFLWQNGKMVDLSTLLPTNSPLSLYDPVTIDDLGVIGGFAFDSSAQTNPAFLAIPKYLDTGKEELAPQVDAAPMVSTPESMRKLMQQRRGHLGARVAQPH
jgi:probable HAF family extracellular repeat protein